jgi:hypothetical protein
MKKTLLFILAFFVSVSNLMAEDADSLYARDLLKPGTEAPDFVISTKDNGQKISLKSLRGHYVVLDFWASWCPDCRKDIPKIKELSDRFDILNVEFVGISFDTNKEVWQNFIKQNKMDWLQFSELKKWKKETKIDQAYHINWIPTMYLIDPEGKIVLGTVEIKKLEAALERLQETFISSVRKRSCFTDECK